MSLKTSIIYDTYWKFAHERQNIFYARLNNQSIPFTQDKILQQYKFTNVYRASDRVSQYLIKNVIYNPEYNQDLDELFFRIILFKIFNKIETWKSLEKKLNNYPSIDNFNWDVYYDILCRLMVEDKNKIYSAAYIMPSVEGKDIKHAGHLELIEKMLKDNLPDKIVNSKSMEEVYKLLLSYSSIGPFLAYQYTIDINYSTLTNFSENDFVMPGPGAKRGIRKCFSDFGKMSESDIIKYVCDNQEKEFERLNLDFKNLFGRRLHLIDCQNLFCEVDKYSRIVHPEFNDGKNVRIKQKFKENKDKIDYYFPPKWHLNNEPMNLELAKKRYRHLLESDDLGGANGKELLKRFPKANEV